MKAPPSINQFLRLRGSRAYNKSLFVAARGTAAINGVPPCRFPLDRAWCSVVSSRALLSNGEGKGGHCRVVSLGQRHAVCNSSTVVLPKTLPAVRCGCLFDPRLYLDERRICSVTGIALHQMAA